MVYLIKTRKCKISSLHIILIIHTNEKLLDSAGWYLWNAPTGFMYCLYCEKL